MKSLTAIILLTTFVAHAGYTIADTNSAGIFKSLSGEVFLVGPQGTFPAAANMKIQQGDTVKTGSSGSVGLIFDDDTAVSLGPNSELAVESFQFKPAEQKLSFFARLLKGTFCFVTGQIAKLAPDKVKFETPEATLGVRGTKFLVKID